MAIFTEMSPKCAKHPTSTRQPGICSSCLRDRLLELAESYNSLHSKSVFSGDCCNSSVASSSPIYHSTTTSSSNFFAPKHSGGVRHARNASDVVKSISMVIGGGGGGSHELKKSRSISVAVVREDEVRIRRGGFWKKLLRITAGREKSSSLVRSRTLKERFDD